MRPTIGVTSNFGLNQDTTPREHSYLLAAYTDAIFKAGGLPQPIPAPAAYDDGLIDEILARLDGILFTGGIDLDPGRWGETPHPMSRVLHPRRERFEVDLFRRIDRLRMPVLGICLGHQIAHVVRGGSLIQHIDNDPAKVDVVHYVGDDANTLHDVRIDPDSRLAKVMGVAAAEVSSRHHQVVSPDGAGRGLRTVATSADGYVEASEDFDGRFLLTVQWHPEDLFDRAEHLALFESLVAAAAARTASRGTEPGA